MKPFQGNEGMKISKHQSPSTREYPILNTRWDESIALRDEESTQGKHQFDLEERTSRFGEQVILFTKKIPDNSRNRRLIEQLVGAGTSIGANYCEADEYVSKKDFRNMIGRCKKEAKEALFFLRMVATSEPDLADEARQIYREGKELKLIFAAIYRKTG
jgi:four helix bundle protein